MLGARGRQTEIHRKTQIQEQLDRRGVKSHTFRFMRSLQAVFEATGLVGGTMVAAPPFFETARRGTQQFWGTGTEAAVVLRDTLTEEERDAWGQESATRRDWILVRRPPKKGLPQQGEQRSEPPGHIILRLKKNRTKPDLRRGGDEKPSRGRAFRERGWWSRGAIEATLNEHGLECWVHEDVKRTDLTPERVRMVEVEATCDCTLEKDE